MPFQTLTCGLRFVPNGLEAVAEVYPFFGEKACGDCVFVETRRQDGAVMLLLVDVTGHGEDAAQTVVLLRDVLLTDPVNGNLSPSRLLEELNNLLIDEFDSTGRFVSAVAMLISQQQGMLTGSNAGHPHPWFGVIGGVWQPWALPSGTYLGILSGVSYGEDTTTLVPGQHLLLMSDGVNEAGARQGNQFSPMHLQNFLAGLRYGMGGDEVMEELLKALQGHVGASWPDDDTSIVVLRFP